MIRLLLVITACILITGCGLFRKSKRVDKSIDKVETIKNIDVKTDVEVKQVSKTEDKTKVVSSSDGHTTIYPTPGSGVKIGADGTITTQADSVVQNVRRNTDEARNLVSDVETNLRAKVDSASKEKANEDKRTSETVSESKPSFWGTVGMWIGIGVAVIGIIWFLIRYLGARK